MLNHKNLQKNLCRKGVQPTRKLSAPAHGPVCLQLGCCLADVAIGIQLRHSLLILMWRVFNKLLNSKQLVLLTGSACTLTPKCKPLPIRHNIISFLPQQLRFSRHMIQISAIFIAVVSVIQTFTNLYRKTEVSYNFQEHITYATVEQLTR